MKTLLPALFAAFVLASSPSAQIRADAPEPPAPIAAPPGDLAQLNAEYEKRRAGALRPVTMWYRAQLEILAQKTEREGRAIAEARAGVAETFWQDDQPELKHALLAPGWIWRSAEDAEGVVLTFLEDGTVHHSALNGTWKITGPCEVTVQPDDDARFVLRFNASLKTFTGDRRGVTGECVLPSVRPAP